MRMEPMRTIDMEVAGTQKDTNLRQVFFLVSLLNVFNAFLCDFESCTILW